MKMTELTFEIDKELYEMASKVFKGKGMTFEEGCLQCVKDAVRLGRLPFECADGEEAMVGGEKQ